MSDPDKPDVKSEMMVLTTAIVKSYVRNNSIKPEALPGLIDAVHRQLCESVSQSEADDAKKLIPAVAIEDSISDDFLICLEDGQKYKSLKRHLRTQYQMTPNEYREKWGLPSDYPMVAKNYSKERSRLAKRTGLGKS